MPVTFTTTLPAPTLGDATASSDTSIDIPWTDNSDNEGGFRVYYREEGSSTWTEFSDLAANTEQETITGLSDGTTYEVMVEAYTTHTTTESGIDSERINLDANRPVTSHASAVITTNSRLVNLTATTTSSVSGIQSSATRVAALEASARSFTSSVTSSSSRVASLVAATSSEVAPITSFTFNKRTSLELLDYDVLFSEDEAVWYTEWFQESRILDSEERLALMSRIVDAAKRPAAVIEVEYDEDGNGVVDATSDPIHVDEDEQVHEVTGIPFDPKGHYRLRISQYSGYNSIYDVSFGVVH